MRSWSWFIGWPGPMRSPISRAVFVPWKKGPTMCPQLSKVTGTWLMASESAIAWAIDLV